MMPHQLIMHQIRPPLLLAGAAVIAPVRLEADVVTCRKDVPLRGWMDQTAVNAAPPEADRPAASMPLKAHSLMGGHAMAHRTVAPRMRPHRRRNLHPPRRRHRRCARRVPGRLCRPIPWGRAARASAPRRRGSHRVRGPHHLGRRLGPRLRSRRRSRLRGCRGRRHPRRPATPSSALRPWPASASHASQRLRSSSGRTREPRLSTTPTARRTTTVRRKLRSASRRPRQRSSCYSPRRAALDLSTAAGALHAVHDAPRVY
mmetsp:Transcript_14440/g.36464  ORF Transcript_14440/g.36464 Transcript_14440/m.36464 type:complete len:259 (+) Transcript_14440:928-1704(+)